MKGRLTTTTLAALLAATASLGCVHGLGSSYDSQICAENALRRAPDPEVLPPNAPDALSEWCSVGDAASCSVLGVMYELGFLVGPNRAHAARLYERACAAGNARACANLGALRTADAPRGTPSREGLALLPRAGDSP